MLKRRHLRVKVLQALYAYYQCQALEVSFFEKNLIKNVEQVYEMYLWALSLLLELAACETKLLNIPNKQRNNELSAAKVAGLHHSEFIKALKNNPEYHAGIKKHRISWDFDPELAPSLFQVLKSHEPYIVYINQLNSHTLKDERLILKYVFKKLILKHPLSDQFFEEKFLTWKTDKEVLQAMMARTFKNFSGASSHKLASLSQNWLEDKAFILDLFRYTVKDNQEFHERISKKTKNWETERIALVDMLLMKLALTEVIHFPSIPIQVTLNEYIEISKEFSTPKSNSFINGILDKILADLIVEGKIQKHGLKPI